MLCNPEVESDEADWYLTGARLSKLADLLSPDRRLWQKWVQEGLPLDLVVEQLLSPQID